MVHPRLVHNGPACVPVPCGRIVAATREPFPGMRKASGLTLVTFVLDPSPTAPRDQCCIKTLCDVVNFSGSAYQQLRVGSSVQDFRFACGLRPVSLQSGLRVRSMM